MNRLDEVMKDLESRGYGEHTERIGKGIVMTYYNPSPLDSILSIGRRIRSREVMEKEQNKEEGYVKGLERRKRKDEILRKMEEEFGPNSKLRGNKDEDNKHKK